MSIKFFFVILYNHLNSDNPNYPYIHHRFGEAFNTNQGVRNYNLLGWNQWFHVVCSNGGIGGVARTYVNGKFFESNVRYERKILGDLIQNSLKVIIETAALTCKIIILTNN